MPMFDFQCEKCEVSFTKLLRSSDVDPDCPSCGDQMNRLISAPGGFILKGNGFYKPSPNAPARSNQLSGAQSRSK